MRLVLPSGISCARIWMEPLGATASVIAVIQLSSRLVEYINGVSGATKDRKRLRESVRSCEQVLQRLKDEADDSEEGKAWSETIKALDVEIRGLTDQWLFRSIGGWDVDVFLSIASAS
ncbi:Ankyrin repeat domain-containing protein 50 [Ilyonectria robusta]